MKEGTGKISSLQGAGRESGVKRMQEKHYVLQYNHDPENRFAKWETCLGPYDSLAEAKAAKERQLGKRCWRIAESYTVTVTRYKVVKE